MTQNKPRAGTGALDRIIALSIEGHGHFDPRETARAIALWWTCEPERADEIAAWGARTLIAREESRPTAERKTERLALTALALVGELTRGGAAEALPPASALTDSSLTEVLGAIEAAARELPAGEPALGALGAMARASAAPRRLERGINAYLDDAERRPMRDTGAGSGTRTKLREAIAHTSCTLARSRTAPDAHSAGARTARAARCVVREEDAAERLAALMEAVRGTAAALAQPRQGASAGGVYRAHEGPEQIGWLNGVDETLARDTLMAWTRAWETTQSTANYIAGPTPAKARPFVALALERAALCPPHGGAISMSETAALTMLANGASRAILNRLSGAENIMRESALAHLETLARECQEPRLALGRQESRTLGDAWFGGLAQAALAGVEPPGELVTDASAIGAIAITAQWSAMLEATRSEARGALVAHLCQSPDDGRNAAHALAGALAAGCAGDASAALGDDAIKALRAKWAALAAPDAREAVRAALRALAHDDGDSTPDRASRPRSAKRAGAKDHSELPTHTTTNTANADERRANARALVEDPTTGTKALKTLWESADKALGPERARALALIGALNATEPNPGKRDGIAPNDIVVAIAGCAESAKPGPTWRTALAHLVRWAHSQDVSADTIHSALAGTEGWDATTPAERIAMLANLGPWRRQRAA